MSKLTRFIPVIFRRRPAAELREAAGTPARRGTVLVLILGALALISVVTLVYFTVGRGDIRTGAGTVERHRIDGTLDEIAGYFNDVISRSALATFVDGQDAFATETNGQILIRKTWDYPFTDSYRWSVAANSPPAPADLDHRFDVTGSYSDAVAGTDTRLPYQPWLSSGVPVELFPSNPAGPPTPPVPATRLYDLTKDWRHLSNFAPDGRFVNLYNLAPNLSGQRISKFDAFSVDPSSSGTWVPRPPTVTGTTTFAEMSWGLTLLQPQANGSARSYPANLPQPLVGGLGNADPNIPAHWTMWQQGAFRIAKDPYFGPGSPEYAPYQWVDADGDGFYDSRWIELVDGTDPANPISILSKDSRYRWFIGARAVDLSALINVNTATDQRVPAGSVGAPQVQKLKLGLYPSEIDLYRILRADDTFQEYGVGYDYLQSPLGDFYNIANSNGYNRQLARDMGETGYNALRWSLWRPGAAVPDPTLDLRTTDVGAPWSPPRPFTGDTRAVYYRTVGARATAEFSAVPTRQMGLSARFGIADLLELLGRRGTNDPNVTSRLEQAVDGRENQSNNNANQFRMGPLRSARTLAAELGTADDENNGEGNGVADTDAWAKVVFDIRQWLTTVSGSRPVRATVVPTPRVTNPPPPPVGKLTAAETTVDAVLAAESVAAVTNATPPYPNLAGRDPSLLFRGYGDALLPYSWRTGFWSDNYGFFRTLSYGYNPELALRLAAHLTANLGDSFDRDTHPSGYTLLIDKGLRNTLPSQGNPTTNETAYPWFKINAGKLDLGDERLGDSTAPNAAALSSPAINVFGIEAQPFITQAASIIIYTDARTPGGDREFDPANPTQFPPITIRGQYSAPVGTTGGRPTNADFIGQILAFQLTNPFDVDIPLTDPDHTTPFEPLATDNDFSSFYLEYNGNLFKLAREGASGLEGIILRPGETRTFYVLSNNIQDMQSRLVTAAGGTDSEVPGDAIQRFIDNQLAVGAFPATYSYPNEVLLSGNTRVPPIKLRRMDPMSGASQVADGDLFGPNNTAGKKRVLLWRTPRDPDLSIPANRAQHMLADRLDDPADATTWPTLDRMIPVGPRPSITGTEAGPEPSPGPPSSAPGGFAAAQDNTGFTIALWGSVKRADSPANTPIGAIPAYCLEAKWSSSNLTNERDTDGINLTSLSQSDFIPNKPNADRTVQEFLDKTMLGTTPPTRLPPPGNPGLYGGQIILSDGTYASMTAAAHEKQNPGDLIDPNGDNKPYISIYPRIPLDNNEFRAQAGLASPPTPPTISTLRIADLLLPMAIGPEYDPGLSPPALANGQSIDPDNCITLSQALALGLNYSNPPSTGDRFSVYYWIGDTNPPRPPNEWSNGAVDRGHLSLTRFAPFEDYNADGVLQAAPGGRDAARFPGIPLGLNVLNTFRTIDPEFGALTQMTPGLLNLNTAALAPMRCVPLFSPTTDANTIPAMGRGPAWDQYIAMSGSGFSAGSPPLPYTNSDMAASLLAYRDKTLVYTRDMPFNPANFADFRDGAINPFNAAAGNGRAQTTGMLALRETPGLTSIGEILAVTTEPGTTNTRMRATDKMDMLGYDNFQSGTVGTSSVLSKTMTGTGVLDTTTDDYHERLLVANAALNSVSVRSDVFAVWFVVHGYQKSDTENLGPADPLVPSIAKRYLLVLDRSNVTRAGERAKVLLFTEVPM